MSIFRHPVRSLLFGLFALYLFMYPGSLVLVALDRVPVWGTWMGGAMLIMLGTIMGLWLVVNYGRRGMVATALILFISWFIEHLGSTTGFPFGSYSYTDVLQPKILNMVPLAIPFAWLLVVPAAVGVTERLLEKGGRVGIVTKVMMAASFALLLDVTIEPFAVHINNYWTWEYAGGYYGIPMSNFVAWWFTSLILAIVMLTLIVPRHEWGGRKGLAEVRRARVLPWLPMVLYVLNLTMFVFGNLGHGQWAAAAIGTLILGYLAFDWFEPGLVRWVLGKRRESGT